MTVPCKHEKTHYERWPDGGDIEVCEDCGMSRHHWEWGESDWTMIEDIEKARSQVQVGINKILSQRYCEHCDEWVSRGHTCY